MTPKKKKDAEGLAGELTFEQSLERLEALVDRMESGEAGLEQSLADYEQGMALIRRCKEVLARAEQRVEELSKLDVANNDPDADNE